jgi:catechol 2,3-dioxygenase-like lactoylglutathione lyase family enzyme
MLARVTLRVADLGASARFYDTVLATLGIERSSSAGAEITWGVFALASADDRHPPTRRLHIGFRAPSRAHVDAFWQAGTEAGYRDAGAPGPRPQYAPDYYGGFLLDPAGNSAEAVHGAMSALGGVIDHVWIRVGDLAAAKRSYGESATGFMVAHDAPERVQFRSRENSFSLVPGEPSEHVHLTFAPDPGTMRRGASAARTGGTGRGR